MASLIIFGVIFLFIAMVVSVYAIEKKDSGYPIVVFVLTVIGFALIWTASDKMDEKSGYNTKVYKITSQVKTEYIDGIEIKRDTIYFVNPK